MVRALLYLALICACGRVGFDARIDGGGSAQGLTVADQTMLPGTAIQLVASEPGVTWSALDGGSISTTGVFSAPTTVGLYRVQAVLGTETAMATVHVMTPPAIEGIAPVGTLTNATGMSHQRHVAFVDGRWWVWFASTETAAGLSTTSSADFATWAPSPLLPTTNVLSGDGRNIDVATQDLGGHHIVHATMSYENGRGRYHVRGEIANGTITWGVPQLINQGGNVSPDGPSVVITPGGQIVDGTGYLATPQTPPLNPCGDGDVVMYTAMQLDTGTTSFDAMMWSQQVIWCVPTRVNARRLIADGETVYELEDDGTNDPTPVNLFMNVRKPDGTWLPDETILTTPPRVFSTDIAYALEDWDVAVFGRTLHAIRRHDGQLFDDATYDLDGQVGWAAAAAPVAHAAGPSSGLVLVPYGTGLLAVEIEPASTLGYAFFDGTAWGPWLPMSISPAVRTAIASGTAAGKRPAIVWTEQLGPTAYQIAGFELP